MSTTETLMVQAMQHFQAQQFEAASRLFAHVAQAQPHNPDAWSGWGAAALELKKHNQARQALVQALTLAPQDPAVLSNLATVERALNSIDQAAEYARQAHQYAPDNPLLAVNWALIEMDRQNTSQSIALFEEILRRHPDWAVAHYHLGHALFTQGELDRARQHIERCLALNPQDAVAFQAWIAILFRTQQYATALDHLNRRLQRAPSDQYSLALKAMALKSLGRSDEADAWSAPGHWIRAYRMEQPPEGFDTMTAWNQALRTHVETHPDLTEVSGQATKNGWRVEHLLQEPLGPVAGLAGWMMEQLKDYLRWMRTQPHPYQGTAVLSHDLKLRGWAVLMYSGGYETPHIHPGGLLSCVYYAAVPDAVKKAADDAGYIGFGQPDPFFDAGYPVDCTLRQPEEGLLLVFPSYFWHHTVPFVSEQRRLSLAFDLELI